MNRKAKKPFYPAFNAIFVHVLVCILLLSVSLFLASCSPLGQAELTEENNGETIRLKVGQTFTLKLESNQTTGYSWMLSEKTDSNIISMTK